MKYILRFNEHPYWDRHPSEREALEQRINDRLEAEAGNENYEEDQLLHYTLDGKEYVLRCHLQSNESFVSGESYTILDLELVDQEQ